MKFLENTRLTGAALLLLLGLNSALLVVLISRKPPVPPPPPSPPMGMMPPPPMGGGPKQFLIHELGLDSVQQSKYQALIDVHHSKIEALMNDIKSNRDSIVGILGATSVDSTKVKTFSDHIAADQGQIESLNYYHFRDVRAICTDAQKPKFDSVIQDALHMMGITNPPPPGPPHGPGR